MTWATKITARFTNSHHTNSEGAMARTVFPDAVMLAWALALKVATSPARTGSSAIMKTIGVAPAAAFGPHHAPPRRAAKAATTD